MVFVCLVAVYFWVTGLVCGGGGFVMVSVAGAFSCPSSWPSRPLKDVVAVVDVLVELRVVPGPA